MKKLIIILVLILSAITSQAQIQTFKTTEFAIKDEFSDWSHWKKSNLTITIDYKRERVIIYSQMPQIYNLIKITSNYNDIYGGKVAEFQFIDQDDDIGIMKIRVDPSGKRQIYIVFNNMQWVYNIKPD